MRKSRFREEKTIVDLAEQERGMGTAEVCRKHGISSATFYIYGRALPLQADFELNCLASCKHLSGVTRFGSGAQMGNPLAHASINGRPARPL